MPTKNKPARGSKTKWIEEAIKSGKAMPKEIQTWIKETHGVEVGANYISGQKAAILKKLGKRKGRPKGSKNKVKVPSSSGAVNKNVTAGSFNGDAATLIQAVKAAALKAGGLKRLQAVVNDLVEMAG